MTSRDRHSTIQRILAVGILPALLLGLWGGATPGSLPSGRSEPVIDAVTPDSAAEGTEVTLLGANFGPSVGALQGTSGVSFNGVWSTPRSWSDNSITVAVPPGAGTGEVVVTVSGRQSAGVEFTVTGEGGTGPAIGTVSPGLGMEGTEVTIRGARFGSAAERGGVSFNGVWASAASWSEEEIRVRVPADATTGNVVVTANGVASDGVAFVVAESGWGEPAIESLSAASGPEGMVVTIEGENFGPSMGALEGTSGVSFNGVWGEPSAWSETVIQVAVPAGAPSGLVTVTVGGEGSNGKGFVVERAGPVIEAVETVWGGDGARVEIRGRNFGPAMEAAQGWSGVSLEGEWGVPGYWSDREIHAAVPAGVSGGLVVVTVGEQSSNGSPFSVPPARTVVSATVAAGGDETTGPEISKLNPDTGQVGSSVKIKGSGFGASRGTGTVSFNGTAVTDYASWSDTKIQVRVPEGATTGPVVVTVDGEASGGVAFTVTGPVPEINANGLSPDRGAVGTSVKVKGLNFGASQGDSTVTFNETPATPRSWSDTKIQVPVPEGATTGPVVVTVDGEASNGVTFTIVTTPVIDANGLSPDRGPVGTLVTVKGGNFGASQGDSTITFNGTAAAPASWTNTKIQAPVPEGATTGPVVVTVDGVASNGVTFTVPPLPRLTLESDLSSVSEPSGTATLTVSVPSGSEPEADLTVTLSHTGTAGEGSDYSVGTLTIPTGEVSGTATLTVIDDTVYEGEERIELTAGASGYAASSVLTIALEEDDEPPPLTAEFMRPLGTHGGCGAVRLWILFSEAISTGAMTLRDSSITVTNGSVRSARRVSGRSHFWVIEIAPSSDADMLVVLPATTDCAAAGAVCTAGGKALSERIEATIPWVDPGSPVVSVVAVAGRVSEGERAEFTLLRTGPTTGFLTVRVRGTTTGFPNSTLSRSRFWPGRSSKTGGYTAVYDDAVVREDRTVTWAIEEGDCYAVSEEAGSAEVVLEENDEAAFALTVDPAEVAEGGTAAVRVEITNGVTFAEAQSIRLDYSGSTATKGDDYRVSPESLILRKGARSVTATLTVAEDGIEEGAETVSIAATHGGAPVGTATLTIAASEASP